MKENAFLLSLMTLILTITLLNGLYAYLALNEIRQRTFKMKALAITLNALSNNLKLEILRASLHSLSKVSKRLPTMTFDSSLNEALIIMGKLAFKEVSSTIRKVVNDFRRDAPYSIDVRLIKLNLTLDPSSSAIKLPSYLAISRGEYRAPITVHLEVLVSLSYDQAFTQLHISKDLPLWPNMKLLYHVKTGMILSIKSFLDSLNGSKVSDIDLLPTLLDNKLMALQRKYSHYGIKAHVDALVSVRTITRIDNTTELISFEVHIRKIDLSDMNSYLYMVYSHDFSREPIRVTFSGDIRCRALIFHEISNSTDTS